MVNGIKTEVLSFNCEESDLGCINLISQQCCVKTVTKSLRLLIDNNLQYKEHTSKAISKARQSWAFIRRNAVTSGISPSQLSFFSIKLSSDPNCYMRLPFGHTKSYLHCNSSKIRSYVLYSGTVIRLISVPAKYSLGSLRLTLTVQALM